MFKKIGLMLIASLVMLGFATANETIKNLNDALALLLKPINNESTQAEVVIHKAKTSAVKAVELAGRALYEKTVGNMTLGLQLTDASYSFPKGLRSKPEMRARAQVDTDILRLLGGQEEANEFAKAIEQDMISELSQSILRKYESAATIKSEVISKVVDEKGNYSKLDVKINFDIDLSKLPKTVKKEEVLITSFEARVSFNLKKITLDVAAIANPKAKEFKKDAQGLKEYIDALLAKDEKTLSEIQSFMVIIDEHVTRYLKEL